MNRYRDKTVVITGAGSGLGAAMADLFASESARLVLLDIDGERVDAKAAELRAAGNEAFSARVDVADEDSVATAATRVADRFGACDVLCANVGVQQFGALDTLSAKDWQWVLSVNFLGAIHTVNAFMPLLRSASGDRHILLTSSASFFQIAVRMGAYIATKYAVTGYGEVLRRELADEGINVSLLFPAGMATRHLESSVAARPSELGPFRLEINDIQAMMADAGIDPVRDMVLPEFAVRNLLDQLDAKAPYIFTHGSYRHQIETQQQAVLEAFDRAAHD